MCSRTFCWELKEKYSFLENTSSSLYPACSKLHREEPSSWGKLSLQKQCSVGSDPKKVVNRGVPDTAYLYLLQYFQLRGSTCSTLGPFFNLPENKHFNIHGTRQAERFILHCFECLSGSLAAFIIILGYFCEYKFIRGTSLIFPTVIWSYVTPCLNWRWKTN